MMEHDTPSELWVPPHARQQVLQRSLDAAGARVIKDGDESYTMVKMGGSGEELYYLPIEDKIAADLNSRLAKSRDDRDPLPQEYNLAQIPTSIGSFSGVKEPNQRFRTAHDLLREIPRRNPIIGGAIGRRQDQASAFGHPAHRKDGGSKPGFRLVMRDETAKPTASAQKRMKEIVTFMQLGGYVREHPETGEMGVWDAEFSEQAVRFSEVLRLLVWDSITFDASAMRMEVGNNEKRYPVVWFKPVDASLIRFAVTPETGKNATPGSRQFGAEPYEPSIRKGLRTEFVQVDPGGMQVMREFAWNELAYLARNKRTDMRQAGYGVSVLEELVDIISGILFGIQFNNNYFNNNHIPPMILALKGANWKPAIIQAFQQQLRLMCGGPGAFFAMPIISSDSPTAAAEVIPLRNMDGVGMFWRDWLLFCISVVAMRMGFDPSELNATVFGSSENSLAQQQPMGKLAYARESGLVPLMVDLRSFFDRHIVYKIEPDFMLEFTGLNPDDPNEERAARQDRMQWGLSTPNRERALKDESPLRFPLDWDLWREVRKRVAEHHGMDLAHLDYLDDADLEEEVAEAYLEAQGKFSVAYDMPVGNGFAFQMIQQELQLAEQEKQQSEQQDQMAQQAQEGGTPQQGQLPGAQQMALGPGGEQMGGDQQAGAMPGMEQQGAPPPQQPAMAGMQAGPPGGGGPPMAKSQGGFWRKIYEYINPEE